MAAIDVRISNVGGIADAQLHLVPGVNVLTGRNGAGKTSALRAVSRAFGADVPLEVRDGAAQGSVEAGGVKLVVKKVVRSTGSAEVELADGGPLADLIDPGLKDADLAAKARVRALLRLVQVPLNENVLATLAGDPEILAAVAQEHAEGSIGDLLLASERVRQHAHRLAREAEQRAQQLAGRAQSAQQRLTEGLEKLGGESGLVDLTASVAEAAGHDAVRALEVARVGAAQRTELERRQAEIRASLGESPDASRYDADLEARRGAVAAHKQRLADLVAQMATERELMAGIESDVRHLEEQKAAEQARAERHREAARVLAEPVTGPTLADVEQLEDQVERAKAAFRAARISDDVRKARELVAVEKESAELEAKRAETLRTAAAGIAERLGKVLSGSDASGLTVSDGRLAELVDGVPMDFERRRSEGQRIRAALRVAAKAYRGQVVPLDGRYWLALDEANRQEFAAAAAELGLYVVTEQPTEGPLHVEHVDVEEVA